MGWVPSTHIPTDQRIATSASNVRAWRPHDLRRRAAARMAELGTLPHAVEAILNHLSGHKAGVAGVYNQATYRQGKRDALEGWAEHVTVLDRELQTSTAD